MRIRTIKPEFFTHEGLHQAEEETGLPIRVAFAGLWCAADREGRFKWEPRRLGIAILPYDGVDFSRVLDALLTRGFVVKYRVGDAWFGAIPSWKKHQIVNNRETASVIPDVTTAEELDASGTRGARVGHASCGERKGKEGKGTLAPNDAWGTRGEPFQLSGATEPAAGRNGEAEKKPRERNLLFDALAAVDGSDIFQLTKDAAATTATALKKIREAWPQVTPDEIRQRAEAYRRLHPTWALTPSALAKHWAACVPGADNYATPSAPSNLR